MPGWGRGLHLGRRRAAVRRPGRPRDGVIVGLDFDGTLAPIVDDPESAHIHPDAPQVLTDLADVVRAVAVVTGRPARQALALGGLDEVGDAIGGNGRELYLFGQYGNERWSSTNRRVITPRPPAGLATFERELPRVLRGADAADAFVEDKGLAVAVHTRRLGDPDAAFDRLLQADGRARRAARTNRRARPPGARGPLARHAQGPGRRVPDGDLEAGGFLFAGDDLGDLEAFEAVLELRDAACPPSWSAPPPARSPPCARWPTWSSTAPRACSTSCASSPPTAVHDKSGGGAGSVSDELETIDQACGLESL